MPPDIARIVEACAGVPGVVALVLGGSRARSRHVDTSDWDIGILFHDEVPFDAARLESALSAHVDAGSSSPTTIGAWGPWIVGGAWLRVGPARVDLLYRPIEGVERVIEDCRAGRFTMHYQPGHPHGFASSIWMGEIAVCRPLHDPRGVVARLKALTRPYPEALARAVVQRFGWEARFSAENAAKAVLRADTSHLAGCAYRTFACVAQVLFARNRRYLINEKGAIAEAAALPITVADLAGREAAVWRAAGAGRLGDAERLLLDLADDVQRIALEESNA